MHAPISHGVHSLVDSLISGTSRRRPALHDPGAGIGGQRRNQNEQQRRDNQGPGLRPGHHNHLLAREELFTHNRFRRPRSWPPAGRPGPQVHHIAGRHHVLMSSGVDHQERAVVIQAGGVADDLVVARELGADLLAERREQVLDALVQRRAAGHPGGGIAVGVAEAAVERGEPGQVALEQLGPVHRRPGVSSRTEVAVGTGSSASVRVTFSPVPSTTGGTAPPRHRAELGQDAGDLPARAPGRRWAI